jgi:hypothetical protein
MKFCGYLLHNEHHPGAAMNKSELIEALAQKQNLTPTDASRIVNTILNRPQNCQCIYQARKQHSDGDLIPVKLRFQAD